MVLLLAAGLLLRGLYSAQTIDPGFEMKGVATIFMDLGTQGYDPSRATSFMQRFRDRIQSLPGVVEVAQAECAPFSHDFSGSELAIPGRADTAGVEYNLNRKKCSALGEIYILIRGLISRFGDQYGHTRPIVVFSSIEWT